MKCENRSCYLNRSKKDSLCTILKFPEDCDNYKIFHRFQCANNNCSSHFGDNLCSENEMDENVYLDKKNGGYSVSFRCITADIHYIPVIEVPEIYIKREVVNAIMELEI